MADLANLSTLHEKLSASLQAQAQSAASCAMAAACMLQAIGSAMSRAQFWRSYIGPAMPYLITVLALIIPRQPQLAAKVAPPCSVQQWQSQALRTTSCALQCRKMPVAVNSRLHIGTCSGSVSLHHSMIVLVLLYPKKPHIAVKGSFFALYACDA